MVYYTVYKILLVGSQMKIMRLEWSPCTMSLPYIE